MNNTEAKMKLTKIERMAPEITDLAREIGDEVVYYGGDYYLRVAGVSLWNTRHRGCLTPDRVARSVEGLREFVATKRAQQSRPARERALAVLAALRDVVWRPGHITQVCPNEVDTGTFARAFGTYDLGITVDDKRAAVHNVASREIAFSQLEAEVDRVWPVACVVRA